MISFNGLMMLFGVGKNIGVSRIKLVPFHIAQHLLVPRNPLLQNVLMLGTQVAVAKRESVVGIALEIAFLPSRLIPVVDAAFVLTNCQFVASHALYLIVVEVVGLDDLLIDRNGQQDFASLEQIVSDPFRLLEFGLRY
jgi:hypothetical protein